MICTTLNKIRKVDYYGYDVCNKLIEVLGNIPKDEEIPFTKIVEICGIKDSIGVFKEVSSTEQFDKFFYLQWLFFLMKLDVLVHEEYKNDWRFVHALQIETRYRHGMATKEQFLYAFILAKLAKDEIEDSCREEHLKEIFLEVVS